MVNTFLFCVCVCVLQVTWRANGIVLYMYEGKVLMDRYHYYQISTVTLWIPIFRSTYQYVDWRFSAYIKSTYRYVQWTRKG